VTDGCLTHEVHVHLAEHDRSTLLALVGTFHRRGVEILSAGFDPTEDSEVGFAATFLATAQQAAIVTASLRNLVDVHDASLLPCATADRNAQPRLR
jgi:acetolactate synthase small subunit